MDRPIRRKRTKSTETTRLEAADWVNRGLEVLAEQGIDPPASNCRANCSALNFASCDCICGYISAST
jgi:hypothetical protein